MSVFVNKGTLRQWPDWVIVSVTLKKVYSLKSWRMGSLNIMVHSLMKGSLFCLKKSANLICHLTELSVVGTNSISVPAFSLEYSHSNNVPATANLSVKNYAGRLVMFPPKYSMVIFFLIRTKCLLSP